MSRSTSLALAALLAAAVPFVHPAELTAEEAAKTAEAKSPAEQLAELEKERDAAKLGHVEKYSAFKPRFEAFAKTHAGTEAALSAELWLLQQEWWNRETDKERKGARERAEKILKAYPDSKQLARMAEYYYVFSSADRTRFLTHLAENSKHDEVKGTALLTQARTLSGDEQKAMYERLTADFAKVPFKHTTIGAIAAARKAPHLQSDLMVGEIAPEITGRTSNGNQIKLSDYRGKVVLLDFWGDW